MANYKKPYQNHPTIFFDSGRNIEANGNVLYRNFDFGSTCRRELSLMSRLTRNFPAAELVNYTPETEEIIGQGQLKWLPKRWPEIIGEFAL